MEVGSEPATFAPKTKNVIRLGGFPGLFKPMPFCWGCAAVKVVYLIVREIMNKMNTFFLVFAFNSLNTAGKI